MIRETSAGALIFYVRNMLISEHPKIPNKEFFDLKDNQPLFLLLKYTNYWGFVKGMIEENERETETARREANEEANLSRIRFLEGFREVIRYFFKLDGKLISKEVIFLLGEVDEEQAEKVKVSFEHEGFKWLTFDDAMRLVKHKNERELLIKANEFLKSYLKQKRLV
jgi:8-oxo-dGTP pyrophosphatase MutT (NUDIX family)